MRKLARELEMVIVDRFFERQAAGVIATQPLSSMRCSLLGAYRKMHIPDDPLFNEKFYFTARNTHVADDGDHKGRERFSRLETRYADYWRSVSAGSVVPRGGPHHSLLGAEIPVLSDGNRWHPSEKTEYGEAQVDSLADCQRAHAIATACTRGRRIGLDTKTSLAPTASSSFGHRSLRSVRPASQPSGDGAGCVGREM